MIMRKNNNIGIKKTLIVKDAKYKTANKITPNMSHGNPPFIIWVATPINGGLSVNSFNNAENEQS